MLVVVVVLGLWVVAGIRFWATFVRGPLLPWRSAFTMALCFVALAATMRYIPQFWDGFLVNIAEAGSYACLAMAAGAVNAYVTALRSELTWRTYKLYAWGGIALAAAILVLWILAPVHSRELQPSVELLPMSTLVAAFLLLSYAPMTLTLVRVAAYCIDRLRATRQPAAGERSGLLLVCGGASVGSLSFALTLCDVLSRTLTGRGESPSSPFLQAPETINKLSLIALAAGALVLLATPRAARRWQAFSAAKAVDPLWHYAISIWPEIHRSDVPDTPERKVIELHDAFAFAPMLVEPSTDAQADRLEAVARSLVAAADHRGDPAVATVAQALNQWFGDDPGLNVALARCFRNIYQQESHAPQ